MQRVIVDASVLIAGLMADGRARHVLTHTRTALYAPMYVFQEIDAHAGRIEARAGLPEAALRMVIQTFRARIEAVPPEAYAARWDAATRLVKEANTHGDEDYVALALALDAPIWTYDHDFRRIPGIRVIGTADVEGA